MSDIFEISASLSECFIIVRFCNRFLGFPDRKMRGFKSAGFFLLLSLSDVLFSQRRGFENLATGFLLLFIFLYALLFLNGKVYEKILIALSPTVTILPINLMIFGACLRLSGYSFGDVIRPGENIRILAIFFSKFAFFCVCEFLVYIRRRRQYSFSGFQWVIQLLCFFISFLLANFILDYSRTNPGTPPALFPCVLIAALNVLLYLLMDKMCRDSIKKEEYRLSQVSLAAQERFVVEARQRYMEMRTLRHDMRHYFMTAAELISTGRARDAKTYIEKILDEKVNPAVSGVDTGSVVVDAVINNRIAVCLKHHIEVKCLIDSRFTDINDMDLSILLSNALDNAIRGCDGVAKPRIELSAGTWKTFTHIIVKNSIASSVFADNPDLETSQDRSAHGFGIRSIREIAHKYGGSVEFKEERDWFIVEIWLES